jgi:hypothetical protein
MSHLYIELNLSKINMLLQLKISHELADINVIDRSRMLDCYICIYDL